MRAGTVSPPGKTQSEHKEKPMGSDLLHVHTVQSSRPGSCSHAPMHPTDCATPLGSAIHPACCSLDVLCGPFNSLGQRSPLVSSGMKVIKGDICQAAVHFLQLLKDDATLLLDLRILQRAVLHKVTQKLYSCNTIPTLASHCLTATQCC